MTKAEVENIKYRLSDIGPQVGRLALNSITELEEKVQGYDRNRDRLIAMGFPTFQSCKEYADKIKDLEQQIEKMKCGGNCKHLYHVNTGGCYDAKCDLTYCDCTNCKDKWELKEIEK